VVSDGRRAGLIDWSHMTDRTRSSRRAATWGSASDIIEASARQFRRDPWLESSQVARPRVWVEKEALVDVVARAADEYLVPYFACRGYVSDSEMEAVGRQVAREVKDGLEPVVIHLGDHDPSGIDMTHDIENRLRLFSGHDVEVQRIALNMDQVLAIGPPPNPAKTTDSRYGSYIARYGHESWELDAIDPDALVQLVRDAVGARIDDWDAWERVFDQDRDTRSRMRDVARRWDDLCCRWHDVDGMLDTAA